MAGRVKKYFYYVLIAADQMVNALLFGYADETFSARVWRKALAGQWPWKVLRCVIDRIFFFEANHCQGSYEAELIRKHSPKV